MSEKKLRILIVDDHEVVRVGLRGLLDRQEGFEVIAEGGNVAEAIAMAKEHHPDIVVLDVRLPDGSGVEACREIRSDNPSTRVIMLTSYSDDEALFNSIMAGASGYLLKQTRSRTLIEAIRTVGEGGSLLDPAVTQQVLSRLRSGTIDEEAQNPLSDLTEQERRILELVAEGRTNKEIAQLVFLAEKTVKHYVSNILSKLQVDNRAAAAALFGRLSGE